MDPRTPYAFGGLVVAAGLVLAAALPQASRDGFDTAGLSRSAMASTMALPVVGRDAGTDRDVRTATATTAAWGGDWIASLSSNDCKGIASGDRSWCDTNDCKGVASKDRSWCDTNLCKGWASSDRTWCDTNDCKGVASKDRSWCDSAQCKAIASGDRTWCP